MNDRDETRRSTVPFCDLLEIDSFNDFITLQHVSDGYICMVQGQGGGLMKIEPHNLLDCPLILEMEFSGDGLAAIEIDWAIWRKPQPG